MPKSKSYPLNCNVISRPDFAALIGVTDQRVTQLVKAGKLDLYDGGVDLDGTNSRATLEHYKRKAAKFDNESDSTNALSRIKTLEGLTINQITQLHKDDIAKIKLALDSQRIEQEIKKTRETLIDRDYVTRVFHRFYTILDQELKPLGERITAEALGVLNIDIASNATAAAEHTKLVTSNVYKTLTHVKRLFNESLDKINADKIT
jgi:hypothetical protein